MLKLYLQKLCRRAFYPTRSLNWYQNKGYVGEDLQQQFDDFLDRQSQEKGRYFKEFQSLSLTRQFIKSGADKLDSVFVIPNPSLAKGKSGEGIYFVLFQGRAEYYESRFRDMANQARMTGATIVGFNPKGFHSSTGKTRSLSDLVDDGVAVVKYLLDKGVDRRNIILQGNSLGSGVQEMVSEHFKLNMGISFRQINGNSFKNLASVVAEHYKLPSLEKIFGMLLKYADWEISYGIDFYKTGPYKMYLRRKGDRTISKNAEFHSMVNHEFDYNDSPDGYKDTNRWLNERNQIIYIGHKKRDPHEIGLSSFITRFANEEHSVFRLINKFIEESKDYL